MSWWFCWPTKTTFMDVDNNQIVALLSLFHWFYCRAINDLLITLQWCQQINSKPMVCAADQNGVCTQKTEHFGLVLEFADAYSSACLVITLWIGGKLQFTMLIQALILSKYTVMHIRMVCTRKNTEHFRLVLEFADVNSSTHMVVQALILQKYTTCQPKQFKFLILHVYWHCSI
jgi:hypothetical protein